MGLVRSEKIVPTHSASFKGMVLIMGFYTAFLLSTALTLFGAASAEDFSQPIPWQDLANTDLIRVNDTYYYSASNMHFSPAATNSEII